MAQFLSRLTGLKLCPAQGGTQADYKIVPRSSGEVDAVKRMLADVIWFYDQFRPEEDYQRAGSPFATDGWEHLVRRAQAIRTIYNLPDQRPYTDQIWERLKGKLSTFRWQDGYEWDSFDDLEFPLDHAL
jgi:hypothetical protein